MTIPEIKPVDLSFHQTVSDKIREGAAAIVGPMPELSSMLSIAADNIESLCDVVKAQQSLILELRQGIIDLGKGGKG